MDRGMFRVPRTMAQMWFLRSIMTVRQLRILIVSRLASTREIIKFTVHLLPAFK
jgi:hypothetical protein